MLRDVGEEAKQFWEGLRRRLYQVGRRAPGPNGRGSGARKKLEATHKRAWALEMVYGTRRRGGSAKDARVLKCRKRGLQR